MSMCVQLMNCLFERILWCCFVSINIRSIRFNTHSKSIRFHFDGPYKYRIPFKSNDVLNERFLCVFFLARNRENHEKKKKRIKYDRQMYEIMTISICRHQIVNVKFCRNRSNERNSICQSTKRIESTDLLLLRKKGAF